MRRISRLAAFAAGAVLTAAFLPGAAVAADGNQMSGGGHGDNELLRASVAGSLPTDPALFGVRAGGAPWTIDRGTVTLRADGRLDVKIDNLIIPTTGVNPLPALAASVVCNGAVVATTATVPFSAGGDARIRATVTLPDRCLAPAVLLNPNGNAGVYIGVTGQEA